MKNSILPDQQTKPPQNRMGTKSITPIVVLLVEDNPGDQRLIMELLHDATMMDKTVTFDVVVAKNLHHALQILWHTAVTIVLLDLSLPDSQGLATCTRLCTEYPNIPIIVLTGTQDTTLATAAIQAGAQDYLIKGHFDDFGLNRAIQYAIERHWMRRDLQIKHAELERSEARRRAMLDKSRDGIIILDNDNIIVYANAMAASCLNSPLKTLVGSVYHNAFVPGQVTEFTITHENGETTTLEARSTHTEWQNTEMCIVYLRDVTSQKQAEQAQKQSEALLEATLASLDDLVFILDAEDRFVGHYFNDITINKPNTLPPFIIGEPYYNILPASANAQLHPALTNVKQTHWVQQVEYAVATANQSYWFSAKVSPRLHNGTYVGATIVIRDISKLKATEADLRQRNRQLELLREVAMNMSLELSLDRLLHVLMDRVVLLLNGRGGCIFLPNQTNTALHLSITTDPNMIAHRTQWEPGVGIPGKIWQENRAMIISAYAEVGEDHCLLPFSSVIGMPITWQDQILGVLTVYSNQHQYFKEHHKQTLSLFANQAAVALQNAHLHRRMQNLNDELSMRVSQRTKELEDAYTRLKSLDATKTKFMADISHELRTPTTNLKLYLSLLELGGPNKIPKYLQVLNKETERLEHIIEGILALSRLDLEMDKYHHQGQLLMPVELLHGVLASKAGIVAKKALTLITDIPPQSAGIFGSAPQVIQAINHVLQNALVYTQEGQVKVSLTETADSIHIDIADTGPGINDDDIGHVFERFFRGQGISQSNIPGMGLGLTIAKIIMDMHNGRIAIHSKVGEGTTVRLTFPIHPPSQL